jgi:hypothetical protein
MTNYRISFVVEVTTRSDVAELILKVTDMTWIKLKEVRVEPFETPI